MSELHAKYVTERTDEKLLFDEFLSLKSHTEHKLIYSNLYNIRIKHVSC